jgi:hypothetical protein
MSKQADNPVLPDETPSRPQMATGAEPMPSELEARLDQIEGQDLTAPGKEATHERPYALPGEDEGPLGEGGQLRGPDAGAGGGD